MNGVDFFESILHRMKRLPLAFALLFSSSCIMRHPAGSFQVLPATPDYVLRSPDSKDTPFPEVLSRFNGFVRGKDWLELRPLMELRIENAYYQPGSSRRGLAGFLGTEIARYQMRPGGGLRLLSVQSMKDRPASQLPVQQLISVSQKHYTRYRFFFEILFKRKADMRGSVLLGADSMAAIDSLTAQLLTAPDTVCGGQSTHCTVFPEACSVSLEMRIDVNGTARTVLWGSSLASIADHPTHLALLRRYAGRLAPVKIDPRDPNALRLPLLPGDRITWN